MSGVTFNNMGHVVADVCNPVTHRAGSARDVQPYSIRTVATGPRWRIVASEERNREKRGFAVPGLYQPTASGELSGGSD
ncbi:hypothetical protein OH77DRAFT_1430168 [Trametes cingulata]|nr:hypothetical protein OH77DRAFT_1430168 [Trametes cingulata]